MTEGGGTAIFSVGHADNEPSAVHALENNNQPINEQQ